MYCEITPLHPPVTGLSLILAKISRFPAEDSHLILYFQAGSAFTWAEL